MHGSSVCRKGGVWKVSNEWERYILGIYRFGKSYDKIHRQGMWQMLRVHEVGGKLLKLFRVLCRWKGMCPGRNGCERVVSG